MSTLVIDAHEKRDVAIFDVPGAYLHAKFPKDKLVLMRLRDEFVDIFFKLYAFILLTSTLVPGINYFVVTTHPLHRVRFILST